MVEDCMALVHLNFCGFMANKKVRQCNASFIDLVQRTTLPKWLIEIFREKSAIQINSTLACLHLKENTLPDVQLRVIQMVAHVQIH